MKLAIIFLAILATVPLMEWFRRNPRMIPVLWTLLALLPFVQSFVPHFKFALVSWADWPGFKNGWPGYATGAELTVMDLVALITFFALPRSPGALPFRLPMVFYVVAVTLSVFQAQFTTPALFYPWQLLRMFFVYVVAYRSCSDPRFIPTLQNGLAAGLVMEMLVVVWQKKTGTLIQPTGTFVHQNLLGMVSYFIALPMFARVLSGYRSRLLIAGIASCAIIVSLTASRGALGFAAVGFFLVFVLSAMKRWTSRKAGIALAGVIAVALATPVALFSLSTRFATTPAYVGALDERLGFVNAASMILASHPMGIGANNFAYFAFTQGYMIRAQISAGDLAEIAPQVHNAYWLTVTETGYVGLIALVALLLTPLVAAFRRGWRGGDVKYEMALGIAVALLMVYFHAMFEWVMVSTDFQYFFVLQIGMLAGLMRQVGPSRARNPAAVSPAQYSRNRSRLVSS